MWLSQLYSCLFGARMVRRHYAEYGLDADDLMRRFLPTVPDFLHARNREVIHESPDSLGILAQDASILLESLMGSRQVHEISRFRYPWALAVIDRNKGDLQEVIAMERGFLGTLCLTRFLEGEHVNYGCIDEHWSRQDFLREAISLAGLRRTEHGLDNGFWTL